MRFKEPIHVECPQCHRGLEVRYVWLMESGRSCPDCGVSFAPIQDKFNKATEPWRNFCNEVKFIMALEKKFGFTIEDEDL